MKLKLLVVLAAMGMAKFSLAACILGTDTPNYVKETLTVTQVGGPIELSSMEPVNTQAPFATLYSSTTSKHAQYSCLLPAGEKVSRVRPITNGSLVLYGPANPPIYKTKVPGIGVRFQYGAGRDLPEPFDYYNIAPNEYGNIIVNYGPATMAAMFYKMGKIELDKVPASYQETVLLLGSMHVGHGQIMDITFLDYAIGDVFLVSTPVCSVDKPINIDYGIVTEEQTKIGFSKPLNFGMTCHSDYGAYKAIASIRSDDMSNDSKSIRVTDSNNNKDSLMIEIKDASNNLVKVDGSVKLESAPALSGQRAEYKWNTVLKRRGGSPAPAKGNFNASAIITLDIM